MLPHSPTLLPGPEIPAQWRGVSRGAKYFHSELPATGRKESASKASVFILKKLSGDGGQELISEKAGEHRHHTNSNKGKALRTAETGAPGARREAGGGWEEGSGGSPAGALIAPVSRVKEPAKCREGG